MRKFFQLIGLVLISACLHAQDPHFSQFFSSPLTLNPAFTGKFNGSWRLAAVIFGLRAQGWPIETVNDKRGGRTVAQYRLSPDDIAKALAGGAA